jgi:hypothetical protein
MLLTRCLAPLAEAAIGVLFITTLLNEHHDGCLTYLVSFQARGL